MSALTRVRVKSRYPMIQSSPTVARSRKSFGEDRPLGRQHTKEGAQRVGDAADDQRPAERPNPPGREHGDAHRDEPQSEEQVAGVPGGVVKVEEQESRRGGVAARRTRRGRIDGNGECGVPEHRPDEDRGGVHEAEGRYRAGRGRIHGAEQPEEPEGDERLEEDDAEFESDAPPGERSHRRRGSHASRRRRLPRTDATGSPGTTGCR